MTLVLKSSFLDGGPVTANVIPHCQSPPDMNDSRESVEPLSFRRFTLRTLFAAVWVVAAFAATVKRVLAASL